MDSGDLLTRVRDSNALSAFNQWVGFEVTELEPGRAVLRLPWRPDLGNHADHLHAGVMAALVETSCGYAAASLVGAVVASNCAVTFLAPGIGSAFVATARSIKAGRRQVFTTAEVHAELDGQTTLIAHGQTILVP